MNGRLSEAVLEARKTVAEKATLSFHDLAGQVGLLQDEGAFRDACRLLEYAQGLTEMESHRYWIGQQQALATCRDPDLHVDLRFDRALEVLESVADLATTRDPETLGIAGAIHQHKWDARSQKQDLETALVFLGRGHEADLDQNLPQLGYPGVNAAWVLDLLAGIEAREAARLGASPTMGARRDAAREIRRTLLDRLVPLEQERGLADSYRYLATVAEAAFGLGDYEEARRWLGRAREHGTPLEWETETTARQLASLATLAFGDDPGAADVSHHAGWQVIEEFLGHDPAGVRSAFTGKVGLALSGGGLRASLFHVGVLARLAELDVLRHVEVLSCVSGGSVVGAYYYLEVQRLLESKPDSEITREDYIGIVRRMEEHFLKGVQRNIRTRVFTNPIENLRMVIDPGYTRTHRAGNLFETALYSRVADGKGNAPRYMDDLIVRPPGPDGVPDRTFRPLSHNWRRKAKVPILVINSTTLNTGHLWQFTASWMGEPPGDINVEIDTNDRLRRMYYHEAPPPHRRVRLGHAVASSASVPGIFAPLKLRKLYPDREVLLVDGGVHDNQGTAGLVQQEVSIVLASDASGQMESQNHPSAGLLGVPLRSNAILMSRVREAQYRELALRESSGQSRGLMYLHLKTGLETRSVDWVTETPAPSAPRPHPITDYAIPDDVQRRLAAVRTDLDSFCDAEAYALMLSGYRMAGHEFRQRVTGFLRNQVRDDPEGEIDWRFLSIDPAMVPGSPAHRSLMRILGVSHLAATKIWRLSYGLIILGCGLLLALGTAVILVVLEYREVSLVRVGTLGAILAASLVATIAGKSLFRILWWRETALRTGIALALGLVGWVAPCLHLYVFDRLFLRRGRIARIVGPEVR